MKAKTLPEVIRAFDPRQPLVGQELKDWYIDRPGNPLEQLKIYLRGLYYYGLWLRDQGQPNQAQPILAQSRNLFLAIDLPQAAALVDRALENTGH